MSTLMLNEILQQPGVLAGIDRANEPALAKLKALFARRKFKGIVAAARGSSDNACNVFKYYAESLAGLPVALAAPSVHTLYGGSPDMSDYLVIGVSQSGKAADVLEVVRSARAQGGAVVTITNDPDSPLASECDVHLFCAAGKELSVAATKTFTAQLYLLARIAAELSGSSDLSDALVAAPQAVQGAIDARAAAQAAALAYADADCCYVLARGYCYGIAQETALKIMETTYVRAKAFASSDFHHGPFAVVDAGTKAILIAPSDASLAGQLEMFEKLRAAGAQVTVFTDVPEKFKSAQATVQLPKVSALAMPFAATAAVQLFAESLSLAKGLSPDTPRGLKKVTVTR